MNKPAQRASGHENLERLISRLNDQNDSLFAQNGELRQELRQTREAAKESFQELKDDKQSLVNENKRLRQRITELEAMVNTATFTKPIHSFATPLKDTNVKDETQSLHQNLTADLSSLCQISGTATNVPSSNNMNFENTVIHIHNTPFHGQQNEED